MASNDSDAPRPVIGVTTYLERAKTGVWDVPAAFLPKVYFDAVTRAGGIVVLLPPQPVGPGIAERVLDGLDGLILTGGKDVDPARYGQHPHPATDAPRTDRDEWEDALLRVALERRVPFFGICRGLQVLNVALGGTLHQHLPDVIGSSRYNAGGGIFTKNEVRLEPATRLASILAGHDRLSVLSYHHQAIDRLADGLVVSASADDGVVQAVELSSSQFAIAVQWHPEESAEDLRLFDALVDAARVHADRRIGAIA
ncbi:gamma-glutamyl-gamma-aminobutyrate hydrolase family protein [Lysobacter korlensis]|uniref:Gamma-glutamyl-gamma-aminobutyrate hydrolase family protein n=1 Tax=Lysobacter korlensis TaxID=553636 RepID=A0ABV6RWG6_9GAMM